MLGMFSQPRTGCNEYAQQDKNTEQGAVQPETSDMTGKAHLH